MKLNKKQKKEILKRAKAIRYTYGSYPYRKFRSIKYILSSMKNRGRESQIKN